MIASTSSAWPLPSTPAMPSTSPAWMVEVDVVEQRAAVDVGDARGPRRASSTSVGDRRLLGARRGQLAADHQLGELAGGDVRRLDRGDGGAAPDDGDLVGDREHLVELVRDEDDGEALGLELAQVVEERVDLLRHQDGGRLVEDEDLGAAVEHLEDLHPLPVADAERPRPARRGRARSRRRRRSRWTSARASPPMPCSFSAPRTTFSRTVRLSASMKCWKTMPMPRAMASAGVAKVTCLAVDLDGALVRLLHAVQDLHQRRLAGAVLADDRVDGAAADRDVDVVVGDDAREPLADPA